MTTTITIAQRISIFITILGSILAIGGMFTIRAGFIPGEIPTKIAYYSIVSILLGTGVLTVGALGIGVCTYFPSKAK